MMVLIRFGTDEDDDPAVPVATGFIDEDAAAAIGIPLPLFNISSVAAVPPTHANWRDCC